MNSSPELTVIVGGVWVLTEKRYSVRFALMCHSPLSQMAVRDSRKGDGMVQSRSLALPERRLARIGVSYSLLRGG